VATNILTGVNIFGVTGSVGSYSNCTTDGEVGCISTASYKAVDMNLLIPANIKSGVTIASQLGNYPSAINLLAGSSGTDLPSFSSAVAAGTYQFFKGDGTRVTGNITDAGTVTPNTANQTFSTSLYRTFTVAGDANLVAGKILSGNTIFGVAGNVTLPAVGTVFNGTTYGVGGNGSTGTYTPDFPSVANVRSNDTVNGATGTLLDCSVDGTIGCVATASFKAVDNTKIIAANFKNGVTIAGVTGNYPSAISPLATNTVASDLTSFNASTSTGSYEFFDSEGTRFSAEVFDSGTISPSASTQNFNGVGLYKPFSVNGDADLVATNILTGVNIFGVNGSLNYSNCTTDGQTNCLVATTGSIVAADTSNFTGWDIRKKRNSSGTVLTFAGLTTQQKGCRNQARMPVYNNITSPATGGLDVFDTIDDENNNGGSLPGGIPPWIQIIGGTTVSVTNDYKCGGIYATGNVNTGITGADSMLSHDPDGNWQDLTPGILPGGANSTNTANGCNANDKHCVFKELMSGIMVTEVAGINYSWQNAIEYCDTLGKSTHLQLPLRQPIPIIGGASYSDWRLPTQKELFQLSYSGIKGLNEKNGIASTFGSVRSDTPTNRFWSSTSASNPTADAWNIGLDKGDSVSNAKGDLRKVVCVRN
jgi:Protein of unknown function (DUF1566)